MCACLSFANKSGATLYLIPNHRSCGHVDMNIFSVVVIGIAKANWLTAILIHHCLIFRTQLLVLGRWCIFCFSLQCAWISQPPTQAWHVTQLEDKKTILYFIWSCTHVPFLSLWAISAQWGAKRGSRDNERQRRRDKKIEIVSYGRHKENETNNSNRVRKRGGRGQENT